MRHASLANAFALSLLLVPACHGAGPYGHAPQYVALDEETRAAAGSRDYDPVMVQRQPEEWRKGTVSLFGVVESRQAGPAGQALLRLSVRTMAPRNVCENEQDQDSCRVTVNNKDFGVVYALVPLRGDDDIGPNAARARSLVRIVGTIGQDVSQQDGLPIVHAGYYRHWPPMTYATTESARDLRQ
jgi:hypothetical protein